MENGEPTFENAAPNLITFCKAFSVDSVISGEYSFNNRSSLWSEERRESVYVNSISKMWWTIFRRRTVISAENCNSREQLCFPAAMSAVPSRSAMKGLVYMVGDSN